LIKAGRVCPQEIDWLLCHYSSHFFRGQIVELLEQAGCMIPEEKRFTNLYSRGNTVCASIYLMLEELLNSGKLQPGQKIFCFVPESGRFTTAYMMLNAVENTNKPMISQISNFLEVPESSTLENFKPEHPNSPQAYLWRELVWIWLTSAILPEIATGIM
jgi:3-oxoacyl-[acyl-carrier-protein] synthase-3